MVDLDISKQLLKILSDEWQHLVKIRLAVEDVFGVSWNSGPCGREQYIRFLLDQMVSRRIVETRLTSVPMISFNEYLMVSEYRLANVVERIARVVDE